MIGKEKGSLSFVYLLQVPFDRYRDFELRSLVSRMAQNRDVRFLLGFALLAEFAPEWPS